MKNVTRGLMLVATLVIVNGMARMDGTQPVPPPHIPPHFMDGTAPYPPPHIPPHMLGQHDGAPLPPPVPGPSKPPAYFRWHGAVSAAAHSAAGARCDDRWSTAASAHQAEEFVGGARYEVR